MTFDPGGGFRVEGIDGLRISEAAQATGFTVSALRFYEKEGVVTPERTAMGFDIDGIIADIDSRI